MSATRDKSQKTTFVYSNLYQIYRKGKEAAKNAPDAPAQTPQVSPFHTTSGKVLKAENIKEAVVAVQPYRPAELLAKHLERQQASAPATVEKPLYVKKPEALLKPVGDNAALTSLKDNLKALSDLHARLRFMLKELEDLTKE